jgi:BA14K-like protein
MINLKVLSSAAAIALVLPIAVPSTSFAQHFKGGKGGHVAMGGGGGAPAARFSGGGARFSGGGGAPVARFSGGASGPVARFNSGAPAARFSGAGTGTTVTRYSSGYGGGWQGGHRYRRGGGGYIPGAVAGAVIGGALASSYAYYGGPGYYSSGYYPGYYDDTGYDDSAVVAVAPAPVGDDAVAYCTQTYRSYDLASGTYLGFDGLRHPCP